MPENERAAENLRKFFLAMSEDMRVLLVKLADRLHNMRTLHFIKSPEKRRASPARRWISTPRWPSGSACTNTCARCSCSPSSSSSRRPMPTITGRLEQIRNQDGGQVDAIALEIKQALAEAGLAVKVSGREKHPYSIWKKMAERHVSFEQITDIMAFRVLAENEADCYRALGVLHTDLAMIPGRFKDYISTPKANGYRSLHTSLIYENSMRVEVQIRTREMHRTNEFGLAAHWAYKQGGPARRAGRLAARPDRDRRCQPRCRGTARTHRLAIYQDRIFAFTPKGALHQLPKGATAVDFAYAVHTDLGAHDGRRKDQRPAHAAAHAAGQWRRGRNHQEHRRRNRSFPGWASSSPARRGQRSAARCGSRNAPKSRRSAASCSRNRRAAAREDRQEGDPRGGQAAGAWRTRRT